MRDVPRQFRCKISLLVAASFRVVTDGGTSSHGTA